jgi:hypothetical protein
MANCSDLVWYLSLLLCVPYTVSWVRVLDILSTAVSFSLHYSSVAMDQHTSSAQERTLLYAMIAACNVEGLCDVLAQQSTIVARRVWQLPSPR